MQVRTVTVLRRTVRLPMRLALLHRELAVGTPVRFVGAAGTDALVDVATGAGFAVTACDARGLDVVRARTLADTVGPGMRVLVCGLNPSIYAADAGVGFARPGNRFWPAALAAGLVSVDRDPRHALETDAVGMTDLVKRATVAAAELSRDEYRNGFDRVERLVEWLRPGAVCFVGLDGWRAAVNWRAVTGWQSERIGGTPTYVMPSTSGLNARTSLADLTTHLRTALRAAEVSRPLPPAASRAYRGSHGTNG